MRVPDVLSFEQIGSDAVVRVKVTGELDLATVPQLQARLSELGATGARVYVDFSELGFIDVAGARALARIFAQARLGEWLCVNPQLSTQKQRLLELVAVGQLVEAA